MHWDAFLNHLAEWFEARGLIAPGGRWVVGASGGPDSTLLLHAMKTLCDRRALGWSLHVAHLHHGLRDEAADADAAFVQQLAEQLGLAVFQERADIRAEVAALGGSTEEVARERRYEFLERVALKTASEYCVVGHHADDNAETLLHRICRGTGLRGLRGMSDVRPIQPGSRVRLVRPLIGLRRATLLDLIAEQKIAYQVDATNESAEFTRGRIRTQVLPLLRSAINPQVTDALLRLAEQASWLGTYLEDAAARTFDSLIVSEGPRYLALNTQALLSKQRIIQAEIVRRAVTLILAREQDLSFAHTDSVLRLAAERGSGKELHLPGAVIVRKRYDRLEFLPHELADAAAPPAPAPVFVSCPGRTLLSMWNEELIAEEIDVDPTLYQHCLRNVNRRVECVDIERLAPPLHVRTRREGDRFHPLGGPGSKSLSDFFTEQKVEPQLRGRIGVLCDQNGPIWVMPLRIDERVKLRSGSRRALRLSLVPLTSDHAEA